MVKIKKMHKKYSIILTVLVMAFCVFSFLLSFVNITFASSNDDDFQAFNSAFTQMLKDYDTLSDTETYVLSEDEYKIEDEEIYLKTEAVENCNLTIDDENEEVDEDYCSVKILENDNSISVSMQEDDSITLEKYSDINRLIVYSWDDLNSCGAVAKAEYNQYHIFQYDDKESTDLAYNYYSNLSGVTDVFYDSVISAESSIGTNTTYSYKSWGASYVGYADYTNTMLEMYGQDELQEVIVAVLDSGIYKDHELFQDRILTEYATSYITDVGTTYNYQDKNGHGTHVSGTIAEATLSNVKIIPVKILNAEGKGYVSGIVAGVNYVIQLKNSKNLNIKVMNMSVGVEGSSTSNSKLTTVVQNAYNDGIASVVSAGNGDEDTGIRIDVANACPANVREAITVAALVRVKSFPTGYTLSVDTYSNYGEYIDFAAPGTSITSAGISSPTSYVTMSGTSMAAPHVTACVALIYSNPGFADYSIDEMYDVLKDNAVDLGDVGWDQDYGYGMVNIADVGVQTSGYVEFSSQEKFPTSSISLSLSYDYDGEGTLKIYYSTDDFTDVVDSSDSLYSNPISISETTKVTAIAYIYNSNNRIVQRSNVTTFTYYYDNMDLLSNYEYELYYNGAIITKYSGELTTLNVPETINGRRVIGIDQFAFKYANVEILNLPSSVYMFYDSAFYGCTSLKEIHCDSDYLIQIGDYAFRDCSNLSVFDVSDIQTIGDYAFASCSSLTSLELPYVRTIGAHAFTKTGIEEMLIGSDIQSFSQSQTDLKMTHIYGYSGTAAETFALNNNIEFTDLNLRIEKNFSNKIMMQQNSSIDVTLSYIGLDVTNKISFSGQSSKISSVEEKVSTFQTDLNITISNLSVGEYTLYVTLTDRLSNSLKTNTLYIEVVSDSAETYKLNFESGDFYVYLNDEIAEPNATLFADFEYTITVLAHEGFDIKKIVINGEEKSINQSITMTIDSDLNLYVETIEKNKLSVSFNTGTHGNIIVENQVVSNTVVSRNDEIVFSIEPKEGYKIQRVVANGSLLLADENGLYHLDDIVSDINVEVTFEEAYYTVVVSLGKGGSMSSSGGDIDNVAHGSSRTFIITPSEGYNIDFVSVNGETISLSNNKFTLDNISENYDIVVSFKKIGSALSNGSVVLTYFLIILAIFIVFVVAKITLYYIRKERNR